MLQVARILALLSLCLLGFATPAFAADRFALVIGNSAYTGSPPLKNPKNDAELIAKTLERVGFKVTIVTDANQKKMRRAMLEFSRTLRRNAGSVGLFYYAGHGLQVNGFNYMVPVTADIKDEDEVRFEGVDVNDFLNTMRNSNSRLNIIILDACRNNPYARSFRSVTRGLAPVQAASGTLIAYSTAPGDVAFDGNGLNSPYTLALSRHIRENGLRVETVFKRVLGAVEDATERKQTPWLTGAFRGEFYFHKKKKKASGSHQGRKTGRQQKKSEPVTTSSKGLEKLFWESIVSSTNPASFEAYLSAFPNGVFTGLAKIKIADLKNNAKKRIVASQNTVVSRSGSPKNAERFSQDTTAPPSGSSSNPPFVAALTDNKTKSRTDEGKPKIAVYRALFPKSSKTSLKRQQVSHLDCHSLWRARNEIYYRHGFCFKSELGIRFFGNSNCTSPKIKLTSLESRNMRTIRTWEIRHRCLNNRANDEVEGHGPRVLPIHKRKRIIRKRFQRAKPKSKPKPKKAFQPGGLSPREQFLE